MASLAAAAVLTAGTAFAQSQTAFTPAAPEPLVKSDLSVTADSNLTVGYLTPAFGNVTLGVAPNEPVAVRAFTTGTGGLIIANTPDVSGKYTASLYGGSVGVFGGFSDRPSLFALASSTAWNVGASVGYAGFYVSGGISDSAAMVTADTLQAWQAGFGYETGNLDLRLTFSTSQGMNQQALVNALDSQQWMIGGIYEINSTIRVKADAFYGDRAQRLSATPLNASGAAAPQGTGARVGVQLRF